MQAMAYGLCCYPTGETDDRQDDPCPDSTAVIIISTARIGELVDKLSRAIDAATQSVRS
jgi:hypothetical protein